MVCIGGSIGKSIICDKRIAFNQQINAITPVQLRAEFLHIAISTKSFFESILDESTGSATPIINRSKWEELLVPVAPLFEQHRIVTKVNELMTLCDQLEQQQETSITAHQTLVETLLATLTNAENDVQDARVSRKAEQPGATNQALTTKDGGNTENAHLQDVGARAGPGTINRGEIFGIDEAWNRIAEHFDTLFTTEHSIQQLKQTILQLAVMGRLTSPSSKDTSVSHLIDKIYEERSKYKCTKKDSDALSYEYKSAKLSIDGNRAKVKARFFCNFITKGTTPSKNELLDEEKIPFLKVYNIVNQSLDFDYKPIYISEATHTRKLGRSKIFPGDVIMNIVGPPLGKVAIISDQYPEWNMNQALAVYRPVGGVSNNYIYYVLSAKSTLESVLKEVKGTAGQDNLSLEQCRDLAITLPSLEEQHRIVAKVNELMALCNNMLEKIQSVQITQLNLTDAIAEQEIN